MKRILSLVLILILSVGVLCACQLLPGQTTTTPTTPTTPSTTDPTPTEPVHNCQYDVNKAKNYLNSLYIGWLDNNATSVNYTVATLVPVGSDRYTVEWSVDNEAITITPDDLGIEATVSVPALGAEDVPYTLTGVITAPDGCTAEISYDLKVPALALNTHEEYMAAKEGDVLQVAGIVVAINSKEAGNKYNHVFLADLEGKGGYYCYSVTEDPATLGVKVGMTVMVSGPMTPYSGMQEIKGGEVIILDETIKEVAPVDITDKFATGADLGALVGMPVVIKGVEIGTQDLEKDTSQYLYFSIGEEQGYVRTYVTDFPAGMVTANDKAAIDADHLAHFGYKADVTGILILYNGAPYLIPMSVTPFTNYVEVEKTPAEKVDAEKGELTLTERIDENTTLELPLVGKFYDDVTISWTVDNTNYTIAEDGKLAIALGEEKVTLTLTATIVCGDVTETKTFQVAVDAVSKMPYVHKPISAPVVGTFKIAMNTTPANGKVLYFNGQLNNKGALMTTDKPQDAVDVIVAVLDEAAGTYSLKVGDKYLEGYLNGTYKNIRFADEPKAWTWNDEAKVFVCDIDGTSYYFGAYKYNDGTAGSTMALSDIKYITGDNLVKVGVSQFPGALSTIVVKEVEASPITTPGAGSFIIVMDTTPANGKPLYFNGELNNKGALMTTDKIENAVDVIVAVLDEAAGTYSLKVGDKYLEGYLNGTYKNIRFADEPKAWTWNDEAKVFVCDIDGTLYYFGAYKYNDGTAGSTMALSDIKYITGDNLVKVGVSQFPGKLSTIEFVSDEPAHEHSFGDATCKAPARCECGETTGEALGHDLVEGVCSRCGAKKVTLTEAAALEDGTLVIIEVTVSKITYNWSDSNKNMSVDVTDGTTTLNAYKLGSKVGVGDVIVIDGKVGSYNNNKQLVNATAEVKTAHVCSEWSNATCGKDSACVVCGAAGEAKATGEHTYSEGTCSVCGAKEPSADGNLATFDFGSNGEATHYDGNGQNPLPNGTVFTSGNYVFDITTNSKVYDQARDAKGNSCIKLGSSSDVGTFTITVPEDVNEVTFYVAGYKAKTSKITINGTEYTLTTSSDNGEYTAFTVDTSTNKTIVFSTVSNATRCMINTVIYK